MYLDYAGAALYSSTQAAGLAETLSSTVWGNPHTNGGPGEATSRAIQRARERTLHHFGVTEATHTLIFTVRSLVSLTFCFRILFTSYS